MSKSGTLPKGPKDLQFVKNDDALRLDPVWQEFIEHILSVGGAEDIHFHVKNITDKGSEAFKELRDSEIERFLRNKAIYERICNNQDDTDSVISSDTKVSRSRKPRRGTMDSYGGSRRGTLHVPNTRRNTRDASPNTSTATRKAGSIGQGSSNKRRNTEFLGKDGFLSRHNSRDQSPLPRSVSRGTSRDPSPSCLSTQISTQLGTQLEDDTQADDTLNTDACSSRRSSISGSVLVESRRNSIDSTHSSVSPRRNTVSTRRGTDNTSNTDSRRSTNVSKLNDETVKQVITNIDYTVIEEPEAENEVFDTGKDGFDTSPPAQGWRTVRRDIEEVPDKKKEDKHLEKVREEDPGGWNLISNTSGYLTDGDKARKALYEKYLYGRSPWFEGLRTYHQYKSAIEEKAQHQRKLSRITLYKRARASSPQRPRPATAATTRPRPSVNQNKENNDSKQLRRPSTCPPLRGGSRSNGGQSQGQSYGQSQGQVRKGGRPGTGISSYRDKQAIAEFRNVTPLRPKTAFTRS